MVRIMSRDTFIRQMASETSVVQAALASIAAAAPSTATTATALSDYTLEFKLKEERLTDDDIVRYFKKLNDFLQAVDAAV